MQPRPSLFTSESVAMGHPDKVADRISDAILDHLLSHDPHARVAVEALVTSGHVVVAGEVSSRYLRSFTAAVPAAVQRGLRAFRKSPPASD